MSLFAACKKQEYQSIEELDAVSIDSYIRANNLTVQPLGNTGMYYQILEEGKGNDIDYAGRYALVYTVRSLDGVYSVTDTFASASRYFDYLGYFLGAAPQGSIIASNPNYQGQIEREEGLKMAIRSMLKKTDGQIRVLIPSRLLPYGRNGNTDLGIPSNASMDYVIRVIDSASMPAYEDTSIKSYLQKNNLTGFERTEGGVYYKITEQGAGDSITVDSTININFKLRLFNGAEVTSSDSLSYAPASWTDAWKAVLPKLKKGGTMTIVSPSSATYGMPGASVGVGSGTITIPPFSSVLYELKLNDKK
ncbi:FKBP-type peptidyl-prolyl cis-trans isomerase [Olivibacter jilunii]|uniref:FKBP-type peptidyl-prolyl cis-trans isomerase n=1 Tax=Olivibacter jilunii TaxID=985016 RepID=UPI003F1461C8